MVKANDAGTPLAFVLRLSPLTPLASQRAEPGC